MAFPGGIPSSSSSQNPVSICYNITGSYSVTLITTSASGNDTLTFPNYVTVYPYTTISCNHSNRINTHFKLSCKLSMAI
jgi:PKD repeat protein